MFKLILMGIALSTAPLFAYLSTHPAQADASVTAQALSSLKASPQYSAIIARARGELTSFERLAATRGVRADQKKKQMLELIESAKSVLVEECSIHQCLGLEGTLRNELAAVESLVKQGQIKQAAARARAVARRYEVI